MKIVIVIVIVIVAVSACVSDGKRKPNKIPEKFVTLEDIVGAWDGSDTYGQQLDERYSIIKENGDVISFNYLGDAYDQGPNCFVKSDGIRLEYQGGGRFLSGSKYIDNKSYIYTSVNISVSGNSKTILNSSEYGSWKYTSTRTHLTEFDFMPLCSDLDNGGVILTFDDKESIHYWVSAYADLVKYGFKATFYVDGYSDLNETELKKMKHLQGLGNELGSHGRTHLGAALHTERFDFSDYLEKEISPELEFAKQNALYLPTYAYPAGNDSEETNLKLSKHFIFLRDVEGIKKSLEEQLSFYGKGGQLGLVTAIGIDSPRVEDNEDYYNDLLEHALNENKIIIFYGHSIEPDLAAATNSMSTTGYSTIKKILKFANSNGMKILKMSDLQKFSN